MVARNEQNCLEAYLPKYEETWNNVSDNEKRWRIIVALKYFHLSCFSTALFFDCKKQHVSRTWLKYQNNNNFIEDNRKYNEGQPKKLQKTETKN